MSDSAILPLPAPEIDAVTEPYWTAAAQNELLLPRCQEGHYFWIPRGFCPEHPGRIVMPVRASGHGTVYSYTIVHRGEGVFAQSSPYVLAYVELDEGPRTMTNIVDCPVAELRIGLPVEVVFHKNEPTWALARFRPASPTKLTTLPEETWI